MEITGKIIAALEPRSGTSARTGNPWMMQTFVLETVNEQYPRRCAFDVFGEDKLREYNIQVGQEYTVSFDIDAREYQGRWYNSIRAWRVTAPVAAGAPAYGAPAPQAGYTPAAPASAPYAQAPTAAAPAPQAPAAPAEAPTATDDLPF